MAERHIVALPPWSALPCPKTHNMRSHPWCGVLAFVKTCPSPIATRFSRFLSACRHLKAGQYIVWDGDRPQNSCLLISGYAYRHKHAGNGGRQIMSIHMKGDIVDLQNSLLGLADHNVQMLTAGEVAMIPVECMRDIAFRHPNVGMAMWYETLVEGSIFREWILNIGRRNARTRIAHLLCEFAMRLEVAELGEHFAYELPITQEQLR